MASIFDKIKPSPENVRKSIDWFKGKVNQLKNYSTYLEVGHSRDAMPEKGFMYFFNYEAKHKLTLPYWDRFPLVLPFNVKGNRMWGLNFHYLPYTYRVQLFASLDKLIKNSNVKDQKMFEIGWQLIKQVGRLKLAKPCVHQYILQPKYVKSKFIMIDSNEWVPALLMPNEQFVRKSPGVAKSIEKFIKQDKQQVWKDSLK